MYTTNLQEVCAALFSDAPLCADLLVDIADAKVDGGTKEALTDIPKPILKTFLTEAIAALQKAAAGVEVQAED